MLFSAYLCFSGTQHWNLHPTGWPISFCGPTREAVLATANTGKTWERFWKNADEWTGRVEIRKKKSLAVSLACMAIYWPSPGFKGRTSKPCFLNRWDFNFCVRSSPLQDFTGRRIIKHLFTCFLCPALLLRYYFVLEQKHLCLKENTTTSNHKDYRHRKWIHVQ